MKNFSQLLLVLASSAMFFACGAAQADPLVGEVLKFEQRPMMDTSVGGAAYLGHDELSTAWATTAPQPGAPTQYQGVFMADDFADTVFTPVVHVKWWGSYIPTNGQTATRLADKFLIAFESDVPADAAGGFSRPGDNLLSQVVVKGALTPASGTFTETLIRGPDPILHEALYEYNAELHCPFPENASGKETVYWLKIVALDDNPQDPLGRIQWGWHNRDYTVHDVFASVPPAVVPGEFLNAVLPSGEPIWHFQDDAVQGSILATELEQCNVLMDQGGYSPQNYVPPYDGPSVIGQYSKDLAFALYTVPEPGTWILLGTGLVGLLMMWRRRN